jgi:hypothetical protein
MKKTLFFTKKVNLTLGLLFISFLGFSQSPTTFTTSGTWVCPQGVTSIMIEAIGGGAGGRTSGSGKGNVGGGGGGGAYSKRSAVSVTAGTSYTITIGSGGTASNAGGNSTATFGIVTITAAGGSVGVASGTGTITGGAGGTVAASAGDVGNVFAGGSGGSGSGNSSGSGAGAGGGGGGGGGSASIGNAGGNALSTSSGGLAGATIATYGGAGGAGGNQSNIGANASSTNYGGGGGGGGESNKAGGSGQTGAIIITFTCPTETATAGADQTVCISTGTLAGNAPSTSGLTGSWSLVSGTATITAPSSATSGVTGLVSGASATLRWTIDNGRCGSLFDDVIITRSTVPTASVTPSLTSGSTGVCYAGTTPVTSVSWTATAMATSYDVYFGAGSLPGSVTSNVTTNSYSTGTLLANTTYYWKVVAKNACGDATGSSTWTFTTASSPCIVYCTPTASSGVDGTGITNVSYSSVNYTTSNTTVYNDYTSQIGSVYQGTAMPISVTTSTGKKIYNVKIWVDWNNDGDFIDSGEEMFSGSVYSAKINGTINVPLTASAGSHRMRVGITQGQKGANNETATPCFTGIKGAFEDYSLNVMATTCTTAIPTVTTNPSNIIIANGASTNFTSSFTNTPNSYLWEVSSDGGTNFTPITNGGVYSTATTATLTLTVVNFGMNGFKYRVSASNACGTSSVSTTATLTITAPSYCKPTTPANTYWIASVASQGNLNDTSYTGSPAYSLTSGSPSVSTPGYADYSAITLATQTPGGGMNFSILLASSVLPGTTKADRQRFSCFVDWNGDGDFVDTGETVYTTGIYGVLETTFGFEIPQSQNPGNYRMRIRSRNTNTPTIDPCTVNSTDYPTGEVEDYTIAVVQDCASKIQSVTNGSKCGTNTVTLGAVGLGGTTQYRWYSAETGGLLLGTTSTGSWTTPVLSSTTAYYVTSFNGSCESLVRTRVVATIVPTTTINFTPTNPTTCGEDNIITINAAGDTTVLDLFVEDFEGATVGLTATITGSSAGADSPWGVRTNTYTPATIIWKPAINSGSVGSNFALTSSDYASALITTQYSTTTSVNTTDFINLTLTFNNYFSYYTGTTNSGKVQVSTNGGTIWTTVKTYVSDIGVASKFTEESIDLSAYINQTNLKLRFEYYGDWADGWAIDDIRFFGTKQLNTTFTWSSTTPVTAYIDNPPTIPYVAQKVTTIYLKPDLSQLESTTFPITVTATLGNGCPVSQLINVSNNTRVWRGINSDWNDPNNWKPVGVPTSSNCVIVPDNTNTIISGTNYPAFAKNLTVKPIGNLELQSSNNLTVSDWINVNTGGVFNVRDKASLVQVNNDINTGIVNVERTSQPMNYYDYTYWNSPVTTASNFTLGLLSPNSSLMYSWIPTISNNQGDWQTESASTIMNPSKGYIVKAPDTYSTSTTGKTSYTATFKGTPNNGAITAPISKGTLIGTVALDNAENDEWNLIGNPYPSGLDASAFLNLATNVPVIDGTVYIWTHNTQPSTIPPDPFYGDYVLNYTDNDYAVFNSTGGTATASTGGTASGFIASGQSFFVKAANGMTGGTTANVTFNNNMRVTGKNSDFFKFGIPKTEKKHRIWLNLTNNSGAFSQILVGYLTGATQDKDRNFDAESFGGNDVTFYSIIPQAQLTIQGKGLPFDENDQIPLGYNSTISGDLSIRIDHIDGIFSAQNIYLEDKLLGVIHNLKEKPYVFNTEIGDFDDRFILRYTEINKTLGTNTFNLANEVKIIVNQSVTIQSTNQLIKNIMVYDLLGRKIDSYKKLNMLQFTLSHLNKTSSGLIVKITLENDSIISKKIIY